MTVMEKFIVTVLTALVATITYVVVGERADGEPLSCPVLDVKETPGGSGDKTEKEMGKPQMVLLTRPLSSHGELQEEPDVQNEKGMYCRKFCMPDD